MQLGHDGRPLATCQICRREFLELRKHLNIAHKTGVRDYLLAFPGATTTADTRAWRRREALRIISEAASHA